MSRRIISLVLVFTLLLGIFSFALAKTFTDVPENREFKMYIDHLVDKEVISGFTDGTFKPADPISRQQMAKIVALAIELEGVENSNTEFKDDNFISDYAKGFINVLVSKGIISGYEDNTFRAGVNLTRQQAAKIIGIAFAKNNTHSKKKTL